MIYRPDDRSLSKLFEDYPASFGGKKPRRLRRTVRREKKTAIKQEGRRRTKLPPVGRTVVLRGDE